MCKGHGMIVQAGDDDTMREVTAAIPSPDPPVVYEVREQQAGEAIAEPQRNPREEHRFVRRKEKVSDSENPRNADPGDGDAQRIHRMLARRGAMDAEAACGVRQEVSGNEKERPSRRTTQRPGAGHDS